MLVWLPRGSTIIIVLTATNMQVWLKKKGPKASWIIIYITSLINHDWLTTLLKFWMVTLRGSSTAITLQKNKKKKANEHAKKMNLLHCSKKHGHTQHIGMSLRGCSWLNFFSWMRHFNNHIWLANCPFLAVVDWIVSFAAVFWMSRNAPPLRDIQKTAAKETTNVVSKSHNS